MKEVNCENLLEWHVSNYENKIDGRRITLSKIESLITNLPANFKVENLGKSYENRNIYKISIGRGSIKILIWSQMHGNESTGTKALFDLFNFFNDTSNNYIVNNLLNNCTLVFIPMLNPDGAEAYTRVNAQHIDLNRDVIDKKAPETNLLYGVLKDFNPKFCFNLHDQRTIFSVGQNKLPNSISFLAPSEDEARTITDSRKVTMSVVVAMNNILQQIIPNQIGRYTDEFYPTATGDNFQKEGHHTILIEAGHFKGDYNREEVRKYNFIALVTGLNFIATAKNYDNYLPYFDIPNNEKKYLDIIYKNVKLINENKTIDVGILFKEELIDNQIIFTPVIEYMQDLSDFNADKVIEMKGKSYTKKENLELLIKK